jgi:hypothetical protein
MIPQTLTQTIAAFMILAAAVVVNSRAACVVRDNL